MAVAAIIIAATNSAVLADVMMWNTFVPLTSGSSGNPIVSDSGGNLYVVGETGVVKLDSNGNRLWNTSLGGTGYAIALDANGNVYVTGYSTASWGNPINVYSGGKDIFIAKLNNNGTLLWNMFLGSSADDMGMRVAVDSGGNIYITGSSYASWGNPLNAYAGANDIVIVKLNTNGVVLWNTFLGSAAGADAATSIAVDGDGSIYIGGYSNASWGNPINPYTSAAVSGTFAAKLNSSGILIWNTFTGLESSLSMALDGKGNVYVGGSAYCKNRTWDNIIDSCPQLPLGAWKGYVLRIDNNGNVVWSTVIGGSNTVTTFARVNSISSDADGNVYATGTSSGTNSIPSWGEPVIPPTKTQEAFAIKLNGNSGKRIWNTFLGGPSNGFGIVADANKNFYVTGYISATWGNPISPYSDTSTIFVAKYRNLDPPFSLPDLKICPGTSTVSIPISLNNYNDLNIEGIELKITFDNTILTYTDATLTGSILDGRNYLLQKNLVGNEIHLAIYAASNLFNGSGIIGYLNFNIAGTGKSDLKFTMSELNAKSVLAQSGSVSTDGGYTVSGHIGYYFNGNPVRDTHLKLTGPKTFESNPNSGSDGNYTVTTDCTSGTYTLKASKTTDLGGVSGTDASDVARHVVGKVVFNCHQKIAADADQDGKLTPVDASRVARHAADPTFCMNTSCVNWAFTPNPITSCPNWPLISYTKDRSVTLPPDATGQDFVAIRLGDVTGNWTPTTTARSVRNHIGTRDNPTYTLMTQPGFACKVPIILSQSSEIRGIDVTVEFDKAVVSAADVTLSGGILDGKGYFVSAINTGVAGEVSFSIYASNDLFTGNGVVAYISFTPVAATQTNTILTLSRFDVNETAVSGAFGNAVCNAYDPYICDFDGNQKRGLPEVIYGLQCIAEVRQNCTCETDLAKVIRTLRVLTGL